MENQTPKTKENSTVASGGNSLYAEQAGEGPGSERIDNDMRAPEVGRQQGQATILSHPLDENDGRTSDR